MSIHLPLEQQKNAKKIPLKEGGFTFKQFFVGHDKSPMKITTDSVLLGAWAPIIPIPNLVLDIGTGCGVIALMLAQRLKPFKQAVINAIDIDEKAILQCKENIEYSSFSNISAKQQDIKLILSESDHYFESYDLIICNPPYFESAIACRNTQRQNARYTKQLSHAELLECVSRLLTKTGKFCVVLPYQLSAIFGQLANQYQLYLSNQLDVHYTNNKACSLVLFCFSREEKECIKQTLCMRHQDKSYTEDFKQLLKDFYLRF